MPIDLTCSDCGRRLRAPDSAEGKETKCPCGATLLIPTLLNVDAGNPSYDANSEDLLAESNSGRDRPNTESINEQALILCESSDRLQRISVDLVERKVAFENCHQLRSGLGIGNEPLRICDFEEILSSRDFLTGEHRGPVVRLIFLLAHLIHLPIQSTDQASIFIGTSIGRARVFTSWSGFSELRLALRQICAESPRRSNWEDDPRLIPIGVVLMASIVGGIIWLLL